MHLVHQLWRNPAQRHPQLVSRHEVVFLQHPGTGWELTPVSGRPPPHGIQAPPALTHPVFAMRQAIVANLHRQVSR